MGNEKMAKMWRSKWYAFRNALAHVGHELYPRSQHISVRVFGNKLLIAYREEVHSVERSFLAAVGESEATMDAMLHAIEEEVAAEGIRAVEAEPIERRKTAEESLLEIWAREDNKFTKKAQPHEAKPSEQTTSEQSPVRADGKMELELSDGRVILANARPDMSELGDPDEVVEIDPKTMYDKPEGGEK